MEGNNEDMGKKKTMAPIKVWHGAIGEIAERVGCDYKTAYKAIKGDIKNELAYKIRNVALAYVKREDAEPIKVRFGGEIELARKFGCGIDSVREALKGSQISPLEMAIREAAKDYALEEEVLPKMLLKYGGGKVLCDTLGCSLETVRLALSGKLASPLARAIRAKAVELELVRNANEPLRKNAPKCEPLGFVLRCGAITEIAKVCNVPISFAYKVVRGEAVLSEKAEKVFQEASKPEYRKPDYSGNAPIRLEFNGIPKLAKEFGCSTSMVKKSLSWKTNTELAIAIRRKAEKMKEEADAICKQLKPLKVKKGAITTLAQVFGCHYNTAYFAINGLSKSDLCREIRAKAHELVLVVDENKL